MIHHRHLNILILSQQFYTPHNSPTEIPWTKLNISKLIKWVSFFYFQIFSACFNLVKIHNEENIRTYVIYIATTISIVEIYLVLAKKKKGNYQS